MKTKTFKLTALWIFTFIIAGPFSFGPKAEAGQNKILCSGVSAVYLKDRVATIKNDKAKHCTLSCFFSWRCGAEDSFELGLLKEIVDVFGPGNAEWADLAADYRGIKLGQKALFTSNPDAFCLDRCQKFYPDQNL